MDWHRAQEVKEAASQAMNAHLNIPVFRGRSDLLVTMTTHSNPTTGKLLCDVEDGSEFVPVNKVGGSPPSLAVFWLTAEQAILGFLPQTVLCRLSQLRDDPENENFACLVAFCCGGILEVEKHRRCLERLIAV